MEPISLLIAGALIAGKVLTGKKRKAAADDYTSARLRYTRSRSKAIDTHTNCINDMHILAVNRTGVIGRQFSRLERLSKEFRSQDSFFSERDGIFGGRSRRQVKKLIDRSRSIPIPRLKLIGDGIVLASAAAIVIQGVEYIDRRGLVHIPGLQTNVHDMVASLPFDHAHGVADALGDFGMLNVADLFGDILLGFGIFKCFSNLKKADELRGGAAELRSESRKLDRVAAEIEGMRQHVGSLCTELNATSYEAFKWTLIGEEVMAKMKASSRFRRTCEVPAWLMHGLRSSVLSLWANLQKPAIS